MDVLGLDLIVISLLNKYFTIILKSFITFFSYSFPLFLFFIFSILILGNNLFFKKFISFSFVIDFSEKDKVFIELSEGICFSFSFSFIFFSCAFFLFSYFLSFLLILK